MQILPSLFVPEQAVKFDGNRCADMEIPGVRGCCRDPFWQQAAAQAAFIAAFAPERACLDKPWTCRVCRQSGVRSSPVFSAWRSFFHAAAVWRRKRRLFLPLPRHPRNAASDMPCWRSGSAARTRCFGKPILRVPVRVSFPASVPGHELHRNFWDERGQGFFRFFYEKEFFLFTKNLCNEIHYMCKPLRGVRRAGGTR